jgi:hypothetical protein
VLRLDAALLLIGRGESGVKPPHSKTKGLTAFAAARIMLSKEVVGLTNHPNRNPSDSLFTLRL